METVQLRFDGKTAVVAKGIGPVAPGAVVDVPKAKVAALLGDGRWSRVNAKTAGAAKEDKHGAE